MKSPFEDWELCLKCPHCSKEIQIFNKTPTDMIKFVLKKAGTEVKKE